MTIILAPVMFAIFPIGLVGNIFLIFVLSRQKRRSWTSTMMYLLNLAISDLLFVSTLPFWGFMYMNNLIFPFGLFMCKLCRFIPTFNMFSSIFFLTAIAIDRWIAVVHSHDAAGQRLRSWPVLKRICGGVWVFASLLACHQIPMSDLMPPHSHDSEAGGDANHSLSTTAMSANLSTTIAPSPIVYQCLFFIPSTNSKMTVGGSIELAKSAIGFFIPVSIITFCYARVVYIVKRRTLSSSRRTPLARVTSLGSTVIVAFIVCWLPMQILQLASALGGWFSLFAFDTDFYDTIYPYTLCLAWSNSILNPLLYACTTPKLRKYMVSLLCWRTGRSSDHGRPLTTTKLPSIRVSLKQREPVTSRTTLGST